MSDAAAHIALRVRQGPGARFHAPTAPAADLLLARRGTAYFCRWLGALSDSQFDATRRLIIARIGLSARALAELVAAAREGAVGLDFPAQATLESAARTSASLPPRALRSLVHHACMHLDVEWRDLSDAQWEIEVPMAEHVPMALRDTPLLRARTVWQGALDLGTGARPQDLPSSLCADPSRPGGL